APILFEACIVLLTSTLDKVYEELDRRTGAYYKEGEEPEYELYMGVRLAEASSQAMWGSAHYCVQMTPVRVKMEHVVELGKMGRDCLATSQLPLSRICHCVTATMATLASHPTTADLIMTSPDDIALSTLMLLVEVFETETFERAGHVKASACAGIAFLACHPFGAEGDECMVGPYRKKLLEMGAFGGLLRAALTSVMDPDCDMIVQQVLAGLVAAAAIGVMYLSTMAAAVDPAELAMYATLLMDSDNSEMIEFLMAEAQPTYKVDACMRTSLPMCLPCCTCPTVATLLPLAPGMWILLRNPDNRKVLGSSFSPNPASAVTKGMMNKLNDAITLHEINEQAQEKSAMIKAHVQAQEGAQSSPDPATPDPVSSGTAPAAPGSQRGSGVNTPVEAEVVAGADREDPQPSTQGLGSRQASQPGNPDAAPEPGLGAVSPQAPGPAALLLQPGGRSPRMQLLGAPPAAGGGAGGGAGEDNLPRGGGEEGGPPGLGLGASGPGAEGLQSSAALRAQATQMTKGKLQALNGKFERQLKDNWGLETLVAVGESWLPAMLEQDETGQATDIPVLKLFEFLVASICLFMIEDDTPPECRELDMFLLSAPRSARMQPSSPGGPTSRTWWTVEARAPEPSPVVEEHMERALAILTQIVGMRLRAAWKSLQLGVLTLWNTCARNAHMERHVVERGVVGRLLAIVATPYWPASLRDIAAGCLEFFMESIFSHTQPICTLAPQPAYLVACFPVAHVLRHSSLAYMPAVSLPEGTPWPKPTPPSAGIVPAVTAYIHLVNSRQPLLEYRGCHGIARICFAAPYGSSTEGGREYTREAKAATAVLGGVDALIALLKRINRRHQDIVRAPPFQPHPNLPLKLADPAASSIPQLLLLLLLPLLLISIMPCAKLHLLLVSPLQLAGKGAVGPMQRRMMQRAAAAEAAAAAPRSLASVSEQKVVAEEDPSMYEKDMSTLEAQQDMYFVALAALLNISVLKAAQPLLAKKGLPVLLGTSTLLYSRAAAVSASSPGGSAEDKLLHLLSGILQNLALHPANRTRLYKAELHGTLALDKLLEQATDISDELRATAALLPPLTSPNSTYSLPSAQRSASPQGFPRANPSAMSLGAASARSPSSRSVGGGDLRHAGGGPGPQASASTYSLGSRSQASRRTASNRAQRLSPNGALLNNSVDTAIAITVRPKVVFPPIVENKEDVWAGQSPGSAMGPNQAARWNAAAQRSPGSLPQVQQASPQPQASWSGTQPPSESVRGSEAGSLAPASETSRAPSMVQQVPGNAGADVMTSDSRQRFLSWLDSTFMAGADGLGSDASQSGNGPRDDGGKRSFRKPLWDEYGDWLDEEPESAKALGKLLCRPLNHLWNDSPEVRHRHGQARWEPAVSEYREVAGERLLNRPAQRLMSTQPPREQEGLMTAATQMLTLGRVNTLGLSQQVSEYANSRPSTREREAGRVALTVLQPHPEVVEVAQSAEEAQQEAAAAGSGPDSGHDMSEPRAKQSGSQAKQKPLPLKVVLGPQRMRQVISFEETALLSGDSSRPTLTVFEKVEGSRVCDGLFPAYQLPNGRKAYMYYNSGVLLDEVSVDAVLPPPRPSTVPQALQQTMPLAEVLNLIAKPPGSAPPFIPYKPVPYLVPLPSRHTLPVKRPDLLTAPAFGDLREDNLQLVIFAKKIIKTHTSTRVEAVEVKVVEEREPWTLPVSIFKPRLKECDARNFLDTPVALEKMFERDWQRACSKEKFTSMMARENKANSKSTKDDKTMLEEVHNVLLEVYQSWYAAFLYYAAMGASDPYHMSLNAYTAFLDECQIADSESNYLKRSDCDTIFIICNFQPDKKSLEAAVNLENALMRYEFLECIVRAGIAKYGKGQATEDVAEAVRLLLQNNIMANLPPAARHVSNDFRLNRLYTEEVDLLLKRHQVLLKALYSRYRLKPVGGGLRSKQVRLEGWLQLCTDAHLVDSGFTLQDAALCFLWSRMYVLDEVKDYQRYSSVTFVDFLEALARVADMKSLPEEADLEAAGYTNILEWAMDKERLEGSADKSEGGAGNSDIFRPRDSAGFETPKTRPLYIKLEMLLDLLFRRLYVDPSNPEAPFNYDGLLKLEQAFWKCPLEVLFGGLPFGEQGKLPAKGKEYPGLGYKRGVGRRMPLMTWRGGKQVQVQSPQASAASHKRAGNQHCNAALNTQRIGESRWRPLELCWWPEQGALPAKGKEYPGLGYKRLRDKQPKAQQQQQQQPAEAQPRGTDQRRGRVVLVDEHRTSRVSSAVHGQQPCERQLDKCRATRPAGWKPSAGRVEHRLVRPAWSQQRDQPVRGLMWCPVVPPRKPSQAPRSSQKASQPAASEPGPSTPPPAKRSKRTKAEPAAEPTKGKAAKAKPAPQPGRWLDRDCNAALNMQRIGESRWRPLELCWWPEQGALPAKGKEYPGLGYKRVRDKPPKAQQQQQPAEAHLSTSAPATPTQLLRLQTGMTASLHRTLAGFGCTASASASK
ncbi:hypothetical protein QJQ45_022487, partial [Haematococcus lacustris]